MSKHMFVDMRVAIVKLQHCSIAAIAVFVNIAAIGTIDVIAAIDAIAYMDDNADAKANVIANHDMPKQEIIYVGWMTSYTQRVNMVSLGEEFMDHS